MWLVFYLKKNIMVRRHAPFDKKNVAPCIADVPFFSVLASPFLQGAAPALVRVTPCPFSLFVAPPFPL
jgi:hypothetical protein